LGWKRGEINTRKYFILRFTLKGLTFKYNKMLSYKDLIKYFGTSLYDVDFQKFLKQSFSDVTSYDILRSDYIISELFGIELGFTNNDAVYDDDDGVVFEEGNPIFSHFILYPKSTILINQLPFETSFSDIRTSVLNKAGKPTQTNEGYADFLNRNFLVDNYKVGDVVLTFDYNAEEQTINFIQARDNELRASLKL
jgi:hypothetical protein